MAKSKRDDTRKKSILEKASDAVDTIVDTVTGHSDDDDRDRSYQRSDQTEHPDHDDTADYDAVPARDELDLTGSTQKMNVEPDEIPNFRPQHQGKYKPPGDQRSPAEMSLQDRHTSDVTLSQTDIRKLDELQKKAKEQDPDQDQ